jgi:glyoxylase-like metal-dependent hydrolase (beta-lactamase superfamily II)
MPIQICNTCGTSHPDTATPPSRCLICEDERQFVPRGGQVWTTPARLADGHVNAWRRLETDLFEIHTHPGFGIGQRALLLRTPRGNILWDCIALLDDATEMLVRGLGGLQAIAISHPHYYTCMQDWARAFGCAVHLHAADADWVMRPDPAIRHWDGETLEILPGVTLLPLAAATVRRIADTLARWRFDRIYGAFPGRQVMSGGAQAVERSAARYIELLRGSQR